MSRFYRFLWFASERYLIFRFSKDWCLIFFLNMGDLLFEQKIWLKVNFMVLYDISKSNVQYWVFHQNCSKSSKKINFTPTFYPFLDFYGNIMCLFNSKLEDFSKLSLDVVFITSESKAIWFKGRMFCKILKIIDF